MGDEISNCSWIPDLG